MLLAQIKLWNNVVRQNYASVNSNWVHLSPRGNPREIVFERANPGHSGNSFCLISLPRGKNDGRIPGGGAKFSETRRNCYLSLQKVLKKTTRHYKFFYLGSLTKPLYFKLKQNHSKSYLQPWYSIKKMNIYIHKYIVLTVVVH